MKRLAPLVVAAAVACDAVPPPPAWTPPPPAMPWLRSFAPDAVTDVATPAATQQIARLRSGASDDAYDGLALRADLDGDGRAETVLASYGFGVAVLDPDHRVIARAPGAPATGSADDLLAVAVGDAQLGAPVLVVASQRGGHRESTVWVTVYRLTGERALAPVFAAPIESHDGDVTRTGSLVFRRAGLWYRGPDERAVHTWNLDPARGRYVEAAAAPATADR
ncbi:MAG TPA: hypothetical protein VFP84_18680 [Kofleriaceae bacterium]|nr:hypothetical protein [Kofleriaceae bacterium]